MVINQGGGAGWEVDGEKRLMPPWASEELYHQLKFFNMLWRDGLMSPGVESQIASSWDSRSVSTAGGSGFVG